MWSTSSSIFRDVAKVGIAIGSNCCDIAKVGITVSSGAASLISGIMIGQQGIDSSSEPLKGVCMLSLACFMVSTVVLCKTGASCRWPKTAEEQANVATPFVSENTGLPVYNQIKSLNAV